MRMSSGVLYIRSLHAAARGSRVTKSRAPISCSVLGISHTRFKIAQRTQLKVCEISYGVSPPKVAIARCRATGSETIAQFCESASEGTPGTT
eukprot:5188766-Prymnesium_polylepis.1